jgi:hypothetical protein
VSWGNNQTRIEREQEIANRSAIDKLAIGCNHLASALIAIDGPLFNRIKTYDEALHKHPQPFADMWIAWRALMDFRDELESIK